MAYTGSQNAYRKLQSLARDHSLVSGGKRDLLIARLREAGYGVEVDEILNPPPPTVETVAEVEETAGESALSALVSAEAAETIVTESEAQTVSEEEGGNEGQSGQDVLAEETEVSDPAEAAVTLEPVASEEPGLRLAGVLSKASCLKTTGSGEMSRGAEMQEKAAHALLALDRIRILAMSVHQAGGVITVSDETDGVVSALQAEGTRLQESGGDKVSKADRLEKAYKTLIEVALLLQREGVNLPEELEVLLPQLHQYVFTLTGGYKLRSVVEAYSVEEAKTKFKKGIVVDGDNILNHGYEFGRGGGWCSGGIETLFNAVNSIELGGSMYERGYQTTLTFRQLDPCASEHTFIFILDGETYEGRSTVRATCLIEAIEKLLRDDVVEGDTLVTSELEVSEQRLLKQNIWGLNGEVHSVQAFWDHTLSYSVGE